MTTPFAYLEASQLWLLAGWTMLHYLWAGLLFSLVAAVGRWLLRGTSANVRYVYALACLLVLTVAPMGIAPWVTTNMQVASLEPANTLDHTTATEIAASPIIELKNMPANAPPLIDPNEPTAPAIVAAEGPPVAAAPTTTTMIQRFDRACRVAASYLPWLWLAGAPITFALLATGLVGAERLRRETHPLADGEIVTLCVRLAKSMRIVRRVGVAICERLTTPVLVGIVRPLILLPPAALTGWSPDQLEMVLLHELAHVRRWDNLVNLLQRLIESVLFFQPAVWIVSHWVRTEREHCCDAVVVRQTDRPVDYAKALAALAAAHFSRTEATLAAAGPVSARRSA